MPEAAFGLPFMAATPGLSYWRSQQLNQGAFAIGNGVPASGAFGLGVQYAMLASYGVGPTVSTAAITAVGVWGIFVTLGLPILGVAAIQRSGQAASSYFWSAVVGRGRELLAGQAVVAAGRCATGQGITMAGDPGVDASCEPAEPGSTEQRADGPPYGLTGAKHLGDGLVAAGHVTVRADPLHRCPALIRCKSELGQVQSLPRLDRRLHRSGATPDHPAHQKPGARGPEAAVSVKDQDRKAGVDAHRATLLVTWAATRR